MKLRTFPRANGRTSLSIVESYRRPKDGKPTTRTVKSLGYLDELEQRYPDPVAHFTKVAEEMTRQKANALAPVSIEIHPAQKIDMRATNRKNIGCAVLLAIYNRLGIETVLRNHTSASKIGYDINAIMRLLVTERLLNPGSKLSAVGNKDAYFFRCDFTKDDVYRALDVFADARDKVISAMNKNIEGLCGRDTKHVFYDVTNYYFESDPDDFRKKGVSKEHRPNPIVQMGLLQDANAIPITYRLFAGNTCDSATMLPVLADMKRGFKLDTVTAVADKGLNCSTNMVALAASGDGFVFSQSIRGTKSDKALRARVLSVEGYKENADGTFKKKSWQGMKKVHLESNETSDGRPRCEEIEVKYVAFWSRKYAERARFEREKVLERSRELANDPGAYSKATHFGAAKYVRGLDVDKETGEVLECAKIRELDLDAIEKDAQADGYYLIVTNRTKWSDEEIIDTYRGLWRIEESFKVTKSDIEARPVYVYIKPHIEAHFLTCYIALTILRILQNRCPTRPSASSIAEELAKVSGSVLEDNWWLFDYRSELTEELFGVVALEHPKRYMRTKEIKGLLKKSR